MPPTSNPVRLFFAGGAATGCTTVGGTTGVAAVGCQAPADADGGAGGTGGAGGAGGAGGGGGGGVPGALATGTTVWPQLPQNVASSGRTNWQ